MEGTLSLLGLGTTDLRPSPMFGPVLHQKAFFQIKDHDLALGQLDSSNPFLLAH